MTFEDDLEEFSKNIGEVTLEMKNVSTNTLKK